MNGFFYGQTEYNYLENTISLVDYVEYSSKYGYDFITITDNNMHAYYKFYSLCLKNNIKPIIGLKVALTPQNFILAYAKNNNGLKNLFKITKLQEINKIVSIEEITKYNKDLFFVIPSDNVIYDHINQNKIKEAMIEYNKLNLEMYLGIDKEINYEYVSKFIVETNIKLLPVCNCNYLKKDDYIVYETITKIGNIECKKNHSYLISKEELNSCTKQYNMDYDIINQINYNLDFKISFPTYSSEIQDSHLYLKELASKGLQKRLNLKNKSNLYNNYLERLLFELNVITDMGYCDYFLIVWDLVKFAKKQNILVGPGRGSAAGSLISYCLGITEIDPLEYNLFFERFLNPQRISMPDIDIDFPDNKREEVISYVKNKYGDNHVCYISAFNTFGLKSSIRDICRVRNVNVDHANLMLNHVNEYGLDDAKEKYKSREELLEILNIATKINGLVRHISTHAAGIILANENLDDFVPLKQGINDIYQSQLEAYDLEKMGFLKIDFLGIRNLALVDNMTKRIKNFNLKNIKLNDKKTYELLKKGDTDGIFQFESVGIKNVLKKLKPSNFNDIVSVLALYRPGPMDNIDLYIKRKEGLKFSYITKELEPILKETYGIIVYQEQIMQIANVIAGYTYAEADILRRAVSKKDKNVLDENRKLFVLRAEQNGFSKISNEIYDLIVKFADYGFNKSHSVAYAKFSYEMAYLKANNPIVFIAETMNNIISDCKEMVKYIAYAKSKNIEVISPKINHSTERTEIFNNKILLPFNSIKKLGSLVSSQIVSQRTTKYESFDDFKKRTSDFLNENLLNNLIYSGAFDEFKLSKKTLIEKSNINESFARYVKDTIKVNDEFEFSVLKEKEVESLGFNLNFNLFNNNIEKIKKYNVVLGENEITEGKSLQFVANIILIKTIETKNNETMAFLDLDLNFTKMSGVIFPKQFTLLKNINQNELVLINSTIQKRNEELQIVINQIKNI